MILFPISFFFLREESRWVKAVNAYEDILLLVAFVPAAIGGLMLMSGNLGSMIFGGVCCMWGIAIVALVLNNEHQAYLKDKEAKEAMAAHREQMAYIERLEASQEKRS